jgi:tetratricopeptide (TPR) repeat protein
MRLSLFSLRTAGNNGLLQQRTGVFLNLIILIYWAGNPASAQETDYEQGVRLIQIGHLEEAVPFLRRSLPIGIDEGGKLHNEYRALLKAVGLRKELFSKHETGKNTPYWNWNAKAEQLRQYYLENHLYSENITLSLEIYRRTKTIVDAFSVVDAFLDTGQFQEALYFVNLQKRSDFAVVFQIEKARIFCKANQSEQARQIIRTISADKLDSPDILLRLARVQGSTRQYASAVKSLRRCFVLTPPDVLPQIKKEVEKSAEFQPILSSSEFTAVMSTKSTLAPNEMKCAQKWIGTTFDERLKYSQVTKEDGIKFDDWKLY